MAELLEADREATQGSVNAPPVARERSAAVQLVSGVARAILWAVGLLVLGVAVWEGYKALGRAFEDTVPVLGIKFPISTTDYSMPHSWDIAAAFMEPARRGQPATLLEFLALQTWVTMREALIGLVIGGLLGVALAGMFSLAAPIRRGLMPWMVVSQTIPLVALAPMIVIWGGQIGLPSWMAVSFISAYLAFFPVAINTLRGLQSPPMVQREFMVSIAAGRVKTFRLLRFPAALPLFFTGLKLAATTSVVGAIVGELSAGTGAGIGRSILNFTYYYSNGPEKLYAAVLVAAVSGVLFVQIINAVERVALRHRVAEGRPS